MTEHEQTAQQAVAFAQWVLSHYTRDTTVITVAMYERFCAYNKPNPATTADDEILKPGDIYYKVIMAGEVRGRMWEDHGKAPALETARQPLPTPMANRASSDSSH